MKHEIDDEVVHALDRVIDYLHEEERHFLESNNLEDYDAKIDPDHIWHSIKMIDHWLAIVMIEKLATAERGETIAAE